MRQHVLGGMGAVDKLDEMDGEGKGEEDRKEAGGREKREKRKEEEKKGGARVEICEEGEEQARPVLLPLLL